MTEQTEKITNIKTVSKHQEKWLVVPASIFVASVLVTLFGIFTLSKLAETSGLYHATQHVMIFLGGVGAGTSLLTALKNRKG